jgi:protein-disulfide isomerase
MAVACAEPDEGEAGGAEAAPAAPAALAPGSVLAEIGEDRITMDEVVERVGEQLDLLENTYQRQRHEAIEEALDEIIRNRVFTEEARALGININQLVAREQGSSPEVSDEDVAAWYQANRERLVDRSIEELEDQIRDLLEGTRREESLDSLQARLAEKYAVVERLAPFRVEISATAAPSKGSPDAAVTLVEFSDFECPFCGRFFPTLGQIEETYGDRVRIVYRQFPIANLHPNAFKAAEASLCAHEQERFWEMHDLLFTEQERLQVRDLKEKAGRLGLDQEAFDQCLDTGKYVEQVQEDLSEARSLGVTGTPALFVNGRPVPGGAVAFDVVAEVIEEELEAAGG